MSGYWATYMYSSNRIASRYFAPHSFKKMKTKLSKDETISSFSVFHNNVVSLNRNLENLQTQLLREVDFILMLSEWLKQKSLMLIHKCAQHICLRLLISIRCNASGVWGCRNVHWWIRIAWLSYFRKDLQ